MALLLWLIALVLFALTARLAAAATVTQSAAPATATETAAATEAAAATAAATDTDTDADADADADTDTDADIDADADADADADDDGHPGLFRADLDDRHAALRHRRRAMREGVEVSVGWRRRTAVRDAVDGAGRDELWLTATWRL